MTVVNLSTYVPGRKWRSGSDTATIHLRRYACDHRTSYTLQYLFNIQWQFGSRMEIGAGYMGNESHRLLGFRDANQAIPFGYVPRWPRPTRRQRAPEVRGHRKHPNLYAAGSTGPDVFVLITRGCQNILNNRTAVR